MQISKPKIIQLIDPNIKRFQIKFPNGKQILLTPNSNVYQTDDVDEIVFASKLKGIFVRDIAEKDYIRFLERKVSEVPTILNQEFTEELAAKVRWSSEEEERMKIALEKLGYDVAFKDHASYAFKKQQDEIDKDIEETKELEEMAKEVVEKPKPAPQKKTTTRKKTTTKKKSTTTRKKASK